MGNAGSHIFYRNTDVLIKIFKLLELEDQLNLMKINKNFHDMIVKNIKNRKAVIKNYFATYDDETLTDYWKENGENIRQIIIEGYGEFFPWKPMKTLFNLTEISIENVKMFKHDIYWMAEKLQNLRSLRLYNVRVICFFEDITNCDFIAKSMRNLQLPFDHELFRLIENCRHLKQLRIDRAQNYIYEETINNEILSMANIKSRIDEIANSFTFEIVCYTIIAKADGLLQVYVDSTEIDQENHVEKFLTKSVTHLNRVKYYRLNSPSIKCINISVNNSPLLQHLLIFNIPQGIKFNSHKTLSYLHLQNCVLTSQDLFAIVNILNLHKLRLGSKSFRQSNDKITLSFPSNFISSLKHLRIDNHNYIFEKFFAPYSEIFKNLKQLKFHSSQIPSSLLEFLATQNSWKLKHLIFDDCSLEIENTDLFVGLKQTELISENLMMFEYIDVNGNFLLQLLTQFRAKNLSIYAPKRHNIAITNKMDYKLNQAGADSWPKSIRSIAIDNFMFCLNRDFWFNYMEACHMGMQFIIYNACHSYLYKLFYNSQIRSKIKSITFSNPAGKVHVDEKVLCQLPISISTIDFDEYCLWEYFEYAELLSILIINF